MHPQLRTLDVRPILHDNHPCILLRDPQRLTDQQIVVPQPLAAVLAYFDGRTSVEEMIQAFQQEYQFTLPVALLHELIEALDEAVLLENARAADRRTAVLEDYRRAPSRPPALAGAGYPANEKRLWNMLQGYLEESNADEDAEIDWSRPIGLLSPHIDYGRGRKVYAHAWKRAARAVREAELVILLGTDHFGVDLFTLTRQSYATPYGVLPTATALVDRLAATVGEEAAFAGELRHRGEHSLELVAVWLHHMRAGRPVPLAPILTGSLYPFIQDGGAPANDPTIRAALDVLRAEMAGKRTLIVASGDLAHVGPAFGGAPLNDQSRRVLRRKDAGLIAYMRAGDATGFFQAIHQVQNRNNVCGVTPIYLMLELLGASRGEPAGYAVCSADELSTSVVTVAGMVFKGRNGEGRVEIGE